MRKPAKVIKRPRKPYVPPAPAERIDAMIWALHGHIYAGQHGYEPLSHAAAREIMDLLYAVRDVRPKATRRSDDNVRAAAVARDLIFMFGMTQDDAIIAACNVPTEADKGDDSGADWQERFRKFELRFTRAMEGFAKLTDPPDSDLDDVRRAASRTPAGRAAWTKVMAKAARQLKRN